MKSILNPHAVVRVLRWSALVLQLLGGCALQGDYRAPPQAVAAAWSVDVGEAEVAPIRTQWWRLLRDPAIDSLVDAALASHPTLAESMARVDEARARLGAEQSAGTPAVSATTSLARGRQLDSGSGTAASGSTGAAGLGLSWEIDLFGRIRHSAEAANRRLDAREADAQGVRLRLTAEVADTVLGLRACVFSLAVQREDVASRDRLLQLARGRLEAGSAAPVEVVRAQTSLALARTSEASINEGCERQVHALAALSGRSVQEVRARVAASSTMGTPPETRLALPATVLLRHPAVLAADREAAAAWADIGAARAARWPRIDLAGLLAGQWLRLGGETFDATARALSADLSAPLLDGGLGRANVEAAQARYRRAVAVLASAVRGAWRDVEDALAAADSARARVASTAESVAASRRLLAATESQWRAGAVSLFELEDAQRQFSRARDSEIAAARDRAQAWVALVRAAGSVAVIPESNPDELHASLGR